MTGEWAAITRGVAFLASAQQADGSYCSYSSPVLQPFRAKQTYRTTFAPALMLAALAGVPEGAAVCDRLAAWLLNQKSTAWSFNYWAVDAPQRETLPYPDDLDDTFCALLGLYTYNPALVPEAALGSAVRLLVSAEARVGGPYRTWLVPKDAPAVWQDVDLAVNSNVACFLERVDSPLPNLTAYMQKAIVAGELQSPYYPSEYPLLYYLARAYNGSARRALAARLHILQRNGHWGTPLRTALALKALKQLGDTAPQRAALHYLCGQQTPDGSWPAEGFCFDPAQAGERYVSGSASLTTAFAIEALAAWRPPAPITVAKIPQDKGAARLLQHIQTQAGAESEQLPAPLRREMTVLLPGMMSGKDGREIALLPYVFVQSLLQPPRIGTSVFVALGLANVYGWLAYTVLDDFLDDEGVPRQLPAATLALRRSVAAFRSALSKDEAFQAHVVATFDRIDGANAWELGSCRFAVRGGRIIVGRLPDYRSSARLYERSSGHMLTPLAILAKAGYPSSSAAALHVRKAFQHYLAARQLNDDLHDWEQDVSRGQISYVVAALLRDLRVTPGAHLLAVLIKRMRTQFWHHTLLTVCDVVSQHIRQARQELRQSGVCKDDGPLHALLDRLDASVATTRAEQGGAEAFLAAYRGDSGVHDHGRTNRRPRV